MAREIDVQPEAEAKKVDGANMTALLIPMPPAEIGKQACFQLKSLSSILHMLSRSDLCNSSKEVRRVHWKQGDVQRVYKSLGREKAFRSRQRASWVFKSFSLSPRVRRSKIFFSRMKLIDSLEPMGDPKRVSLCPDISRMEGNKVTNFGLKVVGTDEF